MVHVFTPYTPGFRRASVEAFCWPPLSAATCRSASGLAARGMTLGSILADAFMAVFVVQAVVGVLDSCGWQTPAGAASHTRRRCSFFPL